MQKEVSSSSQLSVALLMEDVLVAREISNIFRRIGILPYFYADLPNFWFAVMEDVPSLAFVDVRLMGHESLWLKNHPRIKELRLPIAFYCSKKDRPLLQSTYEIPNYGVVVEGLPLEGEIKTLLNRVNVNFELQAKMQSLIAENERLEAANLRLIGERQKNKRTLDFQKVVTRLLGDCRKGMHSASFVECLEKVLNQWDLVEKMTFFELSPNGQKLVSPPFESQKYHQLPSLWLGQICREGIENFAQNLAAQVVFDQFGVNSIPLAIKREKQYPDLLVFLRVASDVVKTFNWVLLENCLSALFCQEALANQVGFHTENRQQLSLYHFLNELDQSFYSAEGEESSAQALFIVDFKDLFRLIKEQEHHRFFYHKFFDDFMNKLFVEKEWPIKTCNLEMGRMALLIHRNYAEACFRFLQRMLKRFPFYKYFENAEAVIASDLDVDVQWVPTSSLSLIKTLEDGSVYNIRLDKKDVSFLDHFGKTIGWEEKSGPSENEI